MKMNSILKVEVPIDGMDCAECTMHVKKAISTVPGVESVVVSLTTEKAFVEFHPEIVELSEIHSAVEGAGYSIPDEPREDGSVPKARNFSRSIVMLFVVG
jgi:Cu+-exporting ATPase